MSPRRGGGDGAPMVPRAEPQSYFGRPVLKPVIWEPHWIGTYLFTGGLGGASLALAAGARASGRPRLARGALLGALAGLGASPPLLIGDLGRRSRFHHMLRVAKPRSPMSVGTWLLTGAGLSAGLAAAAELGPDLPIGSLGRRLARASAPVGRVAEAAGGLLGLGVATYTAVLLADTAVPVWRDAGQELPVLFAASAAASAGAAAALLTPAAEAAPARRLVAGAVAVEVVTSEVMRRRLHPLVARAHQTGLPARLGHAATALSGGGAVLMALAGRRRPVAAVAGVMVLGGSLALRFAVFEAGRASALDPAATVGPQRERLAASG